MKTVELQTFLIAHFKVPHLAKLISYSQPAKYGYFGYRVYTSWPFRYLRSVLHLSKMQIFKAKKKTRMLYFHLRRTVAFRIFIHTCR